MSWARISPAAKAVFPVIACHADAVGFAFPGEETIAALSGRTAKVVRRGIHELQGFAGFEWSPYTTRTGKRSKRFMMTFPPKGQKARSFFFHRGILDGGNWLELKPTAQALYPVMRHFARYEADEDEGPEGFSTDFDDLYQNRKFELCNAEIGLMAQYAGIHRNQIKNAMSNLQKNFLIDPHVTLDGERTWKVYIKPPKIYKASHLNGRLKRVKS